MLLAPNAPGVNYSIVTDTTLSVGVKVRQQVLAHVQGAGRGQSFDVLQNMERQ
jgi:general secretion pathway protein K